MYYQQQPYFYESQQQMKQMQEIVEKQHKQIQTLEKLLKTMQQEIIQLKEKPTMNIERIEYKFDQLKVETLEGTLNIGLTPGSTGEIEDFIVTQDNMQVPVQKRSENVAKLVEEDLRNYLEKDASNAINTVAANQGRQLDVHYSDFMIQDIKSQLPKRINQYLNQITPEAIKQNLSDDEIRKMTVQQLKTDMTKAFSTFIQTIPSNKGGGKS
ncbi:spore germination protein GerPC [Bacillus sp. FJAT-45066]|uniref:spore germination protein GerPC n=1 Tax=Bacillus sp. FJAT-45066 TaxID=2011010 RepID=UPI000BB949C8|nr:spore germination protein GerPC [Bacillus sp. FJAT-45066]